MSPRRCGSTALPIIKVTTEYYHRLAPFRELFQEGVPILMYHKVARRPIGARIKGLYISPRLFNAQMAELAHAGFSTPPLNTVLTQTDNHQKHVIITFDDGFQNVFDHAMPILKKHGLRAMVYLLPPLLGRTNEWDLPVGEKPAPLMDAVQVHQWLAEGNGIGSHTLTHPFLTRIGERQAKAEIHDSKKLLEDQFGVPVTNFCYPYGDYNPQVRDWVAEAGYVTACTTQWGVNSAPIHALELRRISARYPTRNLKVLWKRFSQWTKCACG
jgi:peptidoglycan/xylan/chitin deacetylase (PgdA/CDA1 family)